MLTAVISYIISYSVAVIVLLYMCLHVVHPRP